MLVKGSYGDYGSAVEIELRAESGGVDQCTGGTASASSTDGANAASRAFDDNYNSGFNAWYGTAPLAGSWVAYQFAEPVGVKEVAFTPGYFGSLSYGPSSFSVQYSDNGVDWFTVATFTGLTWVAGETKTLTVTA